MKKILSLALACILCVGALAGCGEKSTGRGEDGRIQLSVGNWPDENADPQGYELQMEKKADFEAEYPDIEIIPDTYQYDVKTFPAKAEGGTLPIIYQTHFTEVDKIRDLGYAADLSKIAKEVGYYDVISEQLRPLIVSDDKLYFVPKSAYSLGLILNVDLFRQAGLVDENGKAIAPKTFDELVETAKIIKEKTGAAGFVFPTTDNQGGWIFTCLAWNFGGEFMENKDGKWTATFGDGKSVEALEWLKALKWEHDVLPASTNINFAKFTEMMASGQIAMAIAQPDRLDRLMINYKMDTADIAIFPLPSGPAESVSLMGGEVYAISNKATAEQVEAAFKWFDFNGVTVDTVTEDGKARTRETYQNNYDTKFSVIGINDINTIGDDTERQKFINSLKEEFRNIPLENIEDFNNRENLILRAEEPVCAQDLYQILDGCIQEVLTNKEADCKAVMEKGASDFQNNFLDYEN